MDILSTCYALYIFRGRGCSVYTQGIRPEFLNFEGMTRFRIEKRVYTVLGSREVDLTRGLILFQRLFRAHTVWRAARRRLLNPRLLLARETTGLNLKEVLNHLVFYKRLPPEVLQRQP